MSQRNLMPYLGILGIAVSLSGMAATQAAHSPPSYQATDVCSVLNNPTFFLHKEILLRGRVFAGMDGANIRDEHCPDEALGLSVEKTRFEQADIVVFFQKIRSFGNRGFATIAGELVATGHPDSPYSLSIYKVSNIARSAK